MCMDIFIKHDGCGHTEFLRREQLPDCTDLARSRGYCDTKSTYLQGGPQCTDCQTKKDAGDKGDDKKEDKPKDVKGKGKLLS